MFYKRSKLPLFGPSERSSESFLNVQKIFCARLKNVVQKFIILFFVIIFV